MEEICNIADKVGAWVLCDGALRGLEINGNFAPTPIEYYERAITTGSISKIGLTGPRIGWMISNNIELIKECWVYKDYTTLCHSGIGEYLATIALDKELLPSLYHRARETIKGGLEILSDWISRNKDIIDWYPSRAGHTAFLRYPFAIDSRHFCLGLLKEEKVLISPGDYFGIPSNLRIRYSCGDDILREGLRRLETYIHRISRKN
jgi:aspartate/methionine/tyrosine aminotransferase